MKVRTLHNVHKEAFLQSSCSNKPKYNTCDQKQARAFPQIANINSPNHNCAVSFKRTSQQNLKIEENEQIPHDEHQSQPSLKEQLAALTNETYEKPVDQINNTCKQEF